DDQLTRTIERPVMLQGRLFNPRRAGEAVVTPHFLPAFHKRLGDTLTLRLPTPAQANASYDPGTDGPPRGPAIPVRTVGVGRAPWGLDNLGDTGGLLPSPALFAHYRANILGTSGQTYINAIARLRGGAAA